MTTSRMQRRRLGTIIDVTAEQFRVEMSEAADGYTLVGFDDQHYVARIGSLVLIPLIDSCVVAEVTGLQEHPNHSGTPNTIKSLEDISESSSRQLSLSPLGTLPFEESKQFSFGVSEFPPLYADVVYAENRDLDRILDVDNQEVEIASANNHSTKLNSLPIGLSSIFSGYDVKVRINDFFGGHAAILGNTGSGKSCTISALLQAALGKTTLAPAGGTTFILFDTNGEYRVALSKLPSPIHRTYARITYRNSPPIIPAHEYDENESIETFCLPHWILSLEEWELLLQASDRVQRPVLRNALGITSVLAGNSSTEISDLHDHILASCFLQILFDSENPTAARSRIRGVLNVYSLESVSTDELIKHLKLNYGNFDEQDQQYLESKFRSLILPDAEIPSYQNKPFKFSELETALELAILYEESHGNRRVRDNCSTLLTRVKSLGVRDEFDFMRCDPLISAAKTADRFVDRLLGISRSSQKVEKKSQIYILDLSTVGDEIVEVISSVITRLLLDRLRRSGSRNTYPVNLILEEAHRYVPNKAVSASTLDATRIFERVAKEGRKYGLFLILSSQRPSELSGTVLSQCSNYIIHRIQNPEDLQHIRKMTPFISESVLNRLASLPKQYALVFGTAVSIPTTFKVRTANPLPHSDDSDVSSHWYKVPKEVGPFPL